jgi:hypothetical protein
MMLDNASYDKVKVLYKLSEVLWFLDKHAIQDAETAGDLETRDILKNLHRDLQAHIEKLRQAVCIVSQ